MGWETAAYIALAGVSAGAGFAISKEDEGKSAKDLKKEAGESAREKRIKRARARERNKTVFTLPSGADGLKKKLGE